MLAVCRKLITFVRIEVVAAIRQAKVALIYVSDHVVGMFQIWGCSKIKDEAATARGGAAQIVGNVGNASQSINRVQPRQQRFHTLRIDCGRVGAGRVKIADDLLDACGAGVRSRLLSDLALYREGPLNEN